MFVELQPSAKSFSQNENFVNIVQKLKLNFNCSALFQTNAKVCLIYFGKDCISKKCFASNLLSSPSNLTSFTILVTLRLLT